MPTESSIKSLAEHPAQAAAPAPLKKHGFLRSNVEAFTVAIVMALIIKQFAYEAFQVPTESMEPTIIGRNPGGDRIIVNKFAYQLKDPKRWEVVVFRYDLSRPVNYVKRAVGLPDEGVAIEHGDIYIRSKSEEDFLVARKPEAVQEQLLANNPVIPSAATTEFNPQSFFDYWQRPLNGASFDTDKNFVLDAKATLNLVTIKNKITPERKDPEASTRDGKQDATLTEPIGDLRLDVTVKPLEKRGAVVLAIIDGTMVGQKIQLELAIDGGSATSKLIGPGGEIANESLAKLKIAANEATDIVLDNVDDRIRVVVDGDLILIHDYVQHRRTSTPGESRVSFGLTEGRAAWSKLAVFRDIYYTSYPGAPSVFNVPPNHYLFLGDNSANSLDARGWKIVGIRLRKDGRVLLGDMEAVSDDFDAPRQSNNPFFPNKKEKNVESVTDTTVHLYLDVQGNRWRLEPGSYDILDLTKFDNNDGVKIMQLHQTTLTAPTSEQIGHEAVDTTKLRGYTHGTPHAFERFCVFVHFTPRHNVMGQANLVFWPIPRMGIIR